jgi:hypothetical protein
MPIVCGCCQNNFCGDRHSEWSALLGVGLSRVKAALGFSALIAETAASCSDFARTTMPATIKWSMVMSPDCKTAPPTISKCLRVPPRARALMQRQRCRTLRASPTRLLPQDRSLLLTSVVCFTRDYLLSCCPRGIAGGVGVDPSVKKAGHP